MSDDRHRQISEKAYRLWEKEGQPAGRDLEHWVQAEREMEGSPTQANEGKGTATRAYNRKAKADLDGPEGVEWREAEAVGKRHGHGEDPAVKRP